MALKISERKQFLAKRKNEGKRVTIGFTGIADLRHFIALEYIRGMMKACADYDINFVNMGAAIKYSLFDDINFLSHYTKNFKFMKPPLIDGLVTWAASLYEFMEEKAIIKTFSDLRPLPMVDIGHLDIPGASMVKIDSNSAIKTLMEHLVTKHHYKNFAFIGTDISEAQKRRLFNFQLELQRHGLKEIPGSVCMMNKKMEAQYIDEQVDKLISRFDMREKREIDAILTGSDIIAAEVIEHLFRRGFSVPRDVAVVGFNNWYESITARSPITTIDLVYFKRGYAAVELLIDKIIDPEHKSETLYYKTDLIVRQSCGCLEKSVSLLQSRQNLSFLSETDAESESILRSELSDQVKKIFPYLSQDSITSLLDSFFADIYESGFDKNTVSSDDGSSASEEDQGHTLKWFRNIMQDYRKEKEFDSEHFQNAVTSLRTLLIPVIKNEGADTIFFAESIFHQMRALISVFQKYDLIADRENPYRLNNIASQSLSFTQATNLEQIFDVLRHQMSVLDIPGAVLALSDEMSYSFPSPTIRFVHPDSSPDAQNFLGQKISEPHLFPKWLSDGTKRYSVMLEVLHNSDQYFGYAFFGIKKLNMAIYDALRMLVSNALYTVYKKEGRIKNTSVSITENQIQNIITKNTDEQQKNGRTRITAEKITGYLTEHMNEMTNIEKMAQALMISKSFLSKKCKELTALSVQQLHEKLKIEQAKNMLTMNYEFSDIASKLGFKNQNYFSNVFKKNTGLSPKNWLKNNS